MKASSLLLLFAFALCSLSLDSSQWLGDIVTNPSEETLRDLAKQLQRTGHIYVPGFLTKETVDRFIHEMEPVLLPQIDSAISIFQDSGEHTRFPKDHPRNVLMPRQISFGPREGLVNTHCPHVTNGDYSDCSRILTLYYSPAVLQFWRSIISRVPSAPTHEHDTIPRNIFVSHDKSGAVYGLRIPPNGIKDGNWHVDEHSFSCVLMLQTPQKGGEFVHAKFAKAWEHMNDPSWHRWNDIALLLSNKVPGEPSTFPVYSISASAGDAYCFYGDEDLHNIGNVEGNTDRIVVVFAYSDKEDFQHNEEINSKNDWVVESESDKCSGRS